MPGSTRVTRPFTTLPTMLCSPRRSTCSSASVPFSRIATRVSPRDALIRISFCIGLWPQSWRVRPREDERCSGHGARRCAGGVLTRAERKSAQRLSGRAETLSRRPSRVVSDSRGADRRRSTRTGSSRFRSSVERFDTTVPLSRQASGSSTPPARPQPWSLWSCNSAIGHDSKPSSKFDAHDPRSRPGSQGGPAGVIEMNSRR